MRLTILVDDYQSEGNNLLAEHGLSFYIEADGKKVLFDAGYSDIFLKNAISLGINILDLDYIVLSHGHYDHTWGLAHYLSLYRSAIKKEKEHKSPVIVAHPNVFNEKFEDGVGEIGSILTQSKLEKFFEVKLSKEPFTITENLIFLGEIPRKNDFEAKQPICKVFIDEQYQDDFVIEDSALVYKNDNETTIITGCSHSGICNIIDYSEKIIDNTSSLSVIGGLHLTDSTEEIIQKTTDYLSKQKIKEIYPCHCTGDRAKLLMAKYLQIKHTDVGFVLIK